MSKNKEFNKEAQNRYGEIEAAEPPLMDSIALSVVQDGKMWKLIEIPYNLASMYLGTPKVLCENDSMHEIEYQFKVNAGDRMFK